MKHKPFIIGLVVLALAWVLTVFSIYSPAQSYTSTSGAFTATSASYSPGVLLALGCGSTTVAVTGARTGMSVEATPTADPGVGVTWQAWVSSNDTVTLRVCTLVAITPTSTTYNVRVSQ